MLVIEITIAGFEKLNLRTAPVARSLILAVALRECRQLCVACLSPLRCVHMLAHLRRASHAPSSAQPIRSRDPELPLSSRLPPQG